MGRDREVRRERRSASAARPRFTRLAAAAAAFGVTAVAVLGGVGLLPVGQGAAQALAPHRPVQDRPGASSGITGNDAATVPADSGSGRRIVFDMSDQRVWLVARSEGKDQVQRTYLVSGSVTDNLQPGAYSVYSKSLRAWGIEDSGTMQYMVRFAHGANAAIGFHDIPELNGAKVQSRDELGTPRSHGCIRQWRPDAQALWKFAPVGTKVVVVA